MRFSWNMLVFVLSLGWLSSAHGGDGDLNWQTISTANFRIHYPSQLSEMGHRTAEICEEAHLVVNKLMGYRPSYKVEVVITDFGDRANGWATAKPYPMIHLYAVPPPLSSSLGDYDDWLRLLVFHEYSHILQLDRASGVPAFLNALFGRVSYPNHNLPSFLLEGGAVWLESWTSQRGRIHSPLFKGYLRAQSAAGHFYGLDAMSHTPGRWPNANIWYLYGGHFIDWIVRKHGTEFVGKFHENIAGTLFPFGVNQAANEATGETLSQLYTQWADDVAQRTRHLLGAKRAAGMSPLSVQRSEGSAHDNLRYDELGNLWSLEGGRKPHGIYFRTGTNQTPTRILEDNQLQSFALCRGARQIVLSRSGRYRGAYSHNDLYVWNRETKTRRQLTHGARLRQPACAPDGRSALAIQIEGGGTQLVKIDLVDGEITPIFHPGALNQVDFPTFHPHENVAVVSVVRNAGRRDLMTIDLSTGSTRALTDDPALETHPQFSPDGRWLLYSSTRSDTLEIHGIPWPNGRPVQLTRTAFGVRGATVNPNMTSMALQTITATGIKIAYTPFKPNDGMEQSDAAQQPLNATIRVGLLAPKPTRYSPWTSIWPVSWSPSFAVTSSEEDASVLGVELLAQDPVELHVISGQISSTPEERALKTQLNYTYAGLRPRLNMGFTNELRSRENGAFYGRQRFEHRENVNSFRLGAALPLSFDTWSASLNSAYYFSDIRPAENVDPTHDPLDPAPRIPEASRSALFAVNFALSNAQSFENSISKEKGRAFNLSLRLRRPELGGDYDTAEASFGYREYIPLWSRQVLAFKVDGALGRGDTGRRVFYALGAPLERNIFLDTIDQIYFGSTMLRGYPEATETGNRYILSTISYRVPLVDVFSGIETVPIFLRRLKFAIFTDWAQARTAPLKWKGDAFSRSVGIELVTEATFGWRLPMVVRSGYAHGFDEQGEDQFYFFMGHWY